MKKVHRSAPVFFKASQANIDSENGVIKDIVIIQSGKDKYGENFDTTFLEQIVTQGNAQPAGVKSRFGHPNMCDSTLGSFLGRYKNFRVGDNGTGRQVALADLHLDDVAKKSPKGNLFDYVVSMTEKNSDMFGNSIVYMPGEQEFKEEDGDDGKKIRVPYERLKSFLASDLVDSPAATDSLFKDTTDFAAIATQFLEENPSIYEILSKNDGVVKEFLSKYKSFKNQKEEMKKTKTFLEKVKALISGETKEAHTTSDGKVINIDGDVAVGSTVTDDAGNPTPNATYILGDGTTIETDADSKISKVTDPENTEAAPANDQAKEIIQLKKRNKELEDQIAADKTAREAEQAEVMKEINVLKAKIKSDFTIRTGQTNLKNTHQEQPKENRVQKAFPDKFKKEEEA